MRAANHCQSARAGRNYVLTKPRGEEIVLLNVKQNAAKRLGMADRAQQQMDVHFPDVPAQWLWRRKKNHGFSTIPRTLPIAMQIIDAQAKGHPAGHTNCLMDLLADSNGAGEAAD